MPSCQERRAAARAHARIRRLRALPEPIAWDFSPASASSITGVLSNRSIAYGIARACRREGAELAFSYQGERFKERVTEFAAEFGSTLVFDCDVADDGQIERHVRRPRRGLADASTASSTRSASRPREAIAGDFLEGLSREAFRIAHDISSYSFPALAKAAAPRLAPSAALLTLTYLGALRSVPNYNTMGLAKASLEASVRYLAASLGAQGRPRQRHLGRADQDAGGLRHQGLRQDPRRRRAERAAAPQRDDRRRRQRRRVPAVGPGRRASPPRSPTSTAASATPWPASEPVGRRLTAPTSAAYAARGTQSTK